ncbi:PREDICTED: F-box/FBD/LRR-repeat protein At1g13570-like [Nicotiana attenuata]|uniref:F-boxfbd/lrr-repeat protein n=1 Tax=Nicotiana attenuata TaxID=49451 RepID=A0A314KNV3_NICAT|nr:PREDICTED: F-box/FBD/LRR-repeat protein At1g13570-like [Nicotiana attenuata]OIT30983.1 f-boxfbd/lrr-repeat protein [Nicotiana attenuata]
MMDICKRLAVGRDKLDRFMDLPINVIHQIQDHMSIEDAARMSILSSGLRYVWASNPKLVFGAQFYLNRKLPGKTDIISTIVSQHHGAIKTFYSIIHSPQHSVVDEWMLLLSGNGLTDLTLNNLKDAKAPYRLPSCVYGVELERLDLWNCIFRPPCSFRCFRKIKTLALRQVSFELDVATSSLWMPNLEKVLFMQCSGIRHLNIYAPELITLVFFGCGTDCLKLGPFMDCVKLKLFAISFEEEVSQNRQDKAVKLTNLLSSWPNITLLMLDRYFLKFFASGTGAEKLPASLNRLRVVNFHNYDFDGVNQIFPLLCILRSSPNLKALTFLLCQRKEGDMEVDLNLLEGPHCMTQGLDNLQTFEIKNFHGSRTELRFVRFILASAPLLQKPIFLVDRSVNESRSSEIRKKLMQFPRASPKSEIIYKQYCWEEEARRVLVG